GLGLRGPEGAARPLAVAVAGAVEGDDAVGAGGGVEEAAGLEVLDHAAVAVQEDERRAFASLDIVQADAIHGEEPSARRIAALGGPGELAVDEGCGGEGGEADDGGGGRGVALAGHERPPFLWAACCIAA